MHREKGWGITVSSDTHVRGFCGCVAGDGALRGDRQLHSDFPYCFFCLLFHALPHVPFLNGVRAFGAFAMRFWGSLLSCLL